VFEKDLVVALCIWGRGWPASFLFYISMLSVISGLVITIITGDTVASGSVYHHSPRNTKW
jgi:hypothetical protein